MFSSWTPTPQCGLKLAKLSSCGVSHSWEEEEARSHCACIRAPCPCDAPGFFDETDATVELKKPLLQRKNKKQKEVKA